MVSYCHQMVTVRLASALRLLWRLLRSSSLSFSSFWWLHSPLHNSYSRPNSKVRGVFLRQSTGKSTATRICTNEPPRHRARSSGQKQLATLSGSTACCVWGKGARLKSCPDHLAMSPSSNVMANMGCRGVEWETWWKVFYKGNKETSAVCEWEHLPHFACPQRLFSLYTQPAVRMSSDRNLHPNVLLNCHP